MRTIKYLLFSLTLLFCSCNDSDDISVSNDIITLDASGTSQTIEVSGSDEWQLVGNTDWVNVSRDDVSLTISSATNPTRKDRSIKLCLVSGDAVKWLLVKQSGSIRSIGDLYPNSQNPEGMIFQLSDGGEHGLICSLDEFVWGVDGTGNWGARTVDNAGAKSYTDGKSNTRYMIETHKDEATFAATYRVFWWLYNKNNNDIDGDWYIPAAFQLEALYNSLTGNTYKEPLMDDLYTSSAYNPVIYHDVVVRDNFDYILETCGGMPFTYGNIYYWSSTDYSATNAWSVRMYEGNGSLGTIAKTTSGWHVRAIKEF